MYICLKMCIIYVYLLLHDSCFFVFVLFNPKQKSDWLILFAFTRTKQTFAGEAYNRI